MTKRGLLALLVVSGCRSDGGVPAPAPVVPDTTAGAVAADSLPADVPPYAPADLDSVQQAMDSVEARLAVASATELPGLLLSLGRLKRLFVAPRGTAHGPYAEARPDEFWYNEIGGDYLYSGRHLQELIARFPAHPLADDAAYELTLLPAGGECEGFVTCYIARGWQPVRPFLEQYGTSVYAPRALARAIEAFESNLSGVADLNVATELYLPEELMPLLAEFDSVTARLPAELRARAAAASSRIGRRLVRRTP